MKAFHLLLGTACIASLGMAQAAETLTVATVNNADMIRMQRLSRPSNDSTPTSSSTGWCWRKTSCVSA